MSWQPAEIIDLTAHSGDTFTVTLRNGPDATSPPVNLTGYTASIVEAHPALDGLVTASVLSPGAGTVTLRVGTVTAIGHLPFRLKLTPADAAKDTIAVAYILRPR